MTLHVSADVEHLSTPVPYVCRIRWEAWKRLPEDQRVTCDAPHTFPCLIHHVGIGEACDDDKWPEEWVEGWPIAPATATGEAHPYTERPTMPGRCWICNGAPGGFNHPGIR